MRIIVLSDGKFTAVISKEDYRRVNRYRWYAHFSKGANRKLGQPYARATVNNRKVYLHRFIMEAPEWLQVDHKNHQTLDCRRENLEVVTASENLKRRRKS